jgi:thioredoxin-related protein
MTAASLVLAAAPKYDPKADPSADLAKAVAEAKSGNKRILIEVGGEWCGWCHRMHAFFDQNEPLRKLRDDNFVVFQVNFSEENRNEKFLAQFPKIEGYPHIFVLDAGGKFLHSQNTGDLELGKGYDLEKFTAFLQQWALKR